MVDRSTSALVHEGERAHHHDDPRGAVRPGELKVGPALGRE